MRRAACTETAELQAILALKIGADGRFGAAEDRRQEAERTGSDGRTTAKGTASLKSASWPPAAACRRIFGSDKCCRGWSASWRLRASRSSDDERRRRSRARAAPGGAPTRALHIILGAAINNPGLAESVRRLNEVSIGWIAEALRRGIATGAIRPDIDVDAEAVMITAFHRGSASYKLVTPTFPIQAVTEIYIVELNRRLLIKAAPQPARRAAAKPAGKKATRPK